ncbi:RpoL/Rpb11 RNA polymerase subunit family protein [Hyperthermus butylicus]|uniref:DNA-directed RNA polymerase subunit Rpo11 n=1 Tax=Hyperthermus butylicus (strain DSM 5456 / JCM 9403 / PLM1-5) TaxID=415426 RepID=A2BNA1_HYPBU|nr:RpoL/Rpb11 RNA polymerase subunit family protein [Hyperthermus butylicus]ABM81462.1 DNA-directed RNA polymerase subunit L [Hyperthermus butylicus DSM 5456]
MPQAGRVKLLKREANTIEVELEGEDQTIANLIAKYAIRKPGVVYASYIISHPLVSNPVIVLSTDGSRDPLDVLEEVLKDIITDAKKFIEEFDRALESGEKCEVKA